MNHDSPIDMTRLAPLWRRVNPPLVRVLDFGVGCLARDVTVGSAYRSCIVLSPHPDDETLGCAATIMRKLSAGTSVHVALATDGGLSPVGCSDDKIGALRRSEFHDACQVLGLEDSQTRAMGFSDGSLRLAGDDLVDAVGDLVRAIGPDEIMTTSPADPHDDHAALGLAALKALTGTPVRLLNFPVWQQARSRHWRLSELSYGWPEAVRTGEFLERKRKALAAYRSQLPVMTEDGDNSEGPLDMRFIRQFLGSYEMFFPVARR